MTELNIGKERLKIVYGRQEHRKIGERINEFIGDEEEGNIIVRGDFNVRIGELGGRNIEERDIERYSKDKVIGNGGKQLAEWIMEKGGYCYAPVCFLLACSPKQEDRLPRRELQLFINESGSSRRPCGRARSYFVIFLE